MDSGRDYCPVSVNLSRHDLEMAGLHEKINGILDRYGVSHDNIHFEITESALISSEGIIHDHLDRFHKDGYEVWLDDFGSGYSTLSTLQNGDFDCLKIDMLFLRRKNERTPALMKSIVETAKKFGITTLTEGVETEDDYEFICQLGCTLAQGYLFSKPLPLDELKKSGTILRSGTETKDEHFFYRKVGKVNILDPSDALGIYRSEDELPTALIETSDTYPKFLYANEAYHNILKEVIGIPWKNVVDREKMPDDSLYRKFTELAKEAKESGKTAYFDFISGKKVRRMSVSFITEYGSKCAYLVHMADFSLP